MYRMRLGPDEEEKMVSEYVAAHMRAMPPRFTRQNHTPGDMDCQDAQQHVVQGAGRAHRSTGFRVTAARLHERDPEGHLPETRCASDPRDRQG